MSRLVATLLLLPALASGQTFQAERLAIILEDGTKLDSAAGDMQLSGELTISGSRIYMWGQICIDSACASKGLGGSITKLGHAGSTVTINWDDRTVDEYSIISRSPLILFSADDSGSSVEVWTVTP